MITSILEFRKFLKETMLPIANDTLTSPEPGGAQANAANLGTGTGPLDLINPTATEQNIYQRYIELKQSGKLRSELLPQLAQEFNVAVEDLPNMITNPENLSNTGVSTNESLLPFEVEKMKKDLGDQGRYLIMSGTEANIAAFMHELNTEQLQWVVRINPTNVKVYVAPERETFTSTMEVAEEFPFKAQEIADLNKRLIAEGYLDPVSPAKMQKKVDEVNALIGAAIDTDGDPIGVIDTSGTWQAEMKYKPIIYKNGYVYIEYDQQGERQPNKERFKPSDSYDAYQTLSQIATWYRRAMKKQGITPPISFKSGLDKLTQQHSGGFKAGELPPMLGVPGTQPRKTMPPHKSNNKPTE